MAESGDDCHVLWPRVDFSLLFQACRIFGLRPEALKQAGITHVVSAVRLPPHLSIFESSKRMFIEVDDVEEENLLERFTESNKFISNALEAGGVVLIHWFVNAFFRADHYGLGFFGLFPTILSFHGAQLIYIYFFCPNLVQLVGLGQLPYSLLI